LVSAAAGQHHFTEQQLLSKSNSLKGPMKINTKDRDTIIVESFNNKK
jgi:hypothetical protein